LVVWGFELRASMLAGQMFYHLSHAFRPQWDLLKLVILVTVLEDFWERYFKH
jgi:hypothetical protein